MNKKQTLAIASSSVLAAGMAHGDVVYSGLQNYHLAGNQAYFLDLTGIAVIDYKIGFDNANQQKPFIDARSTASQNPNAWVLSRTNTGCPITPFGTNINAAYAAIYPTNKLGYLYQNGGETVVGDWNSAVNTDAFVGLELTDGSTTTNYGWVHLIYQGANSANAAKSLTVVDYAYETIPSKGIFAGATANVDVPVIYQEPQSRTNGVLTTATFTVVALADPAPTYQWLAGSGGVYTNLPEDSHFVGTTTPTLAINSVGLSDALDYIVVVSNSLATATSAPPAHLTVVPAVLAGPIPAQEELYSGLNGHFGIQVLSGVTTGFQWRKGGVTLTDNVKYPGLATSNLVINGLVPGDAGNYDVVVATSIGSVTSSVAPLSLVSPDGSPYEAGVLAAGPVDYYRLNETGSPSGGGLVAYDYTGGNNGIYGIDVVDNVTGPTTAAGFPGFAGANTGVQFAVSDVNSQIALMPWNLNTNTVTLTAWLNPSGNQASGAGVIYTRSTNLMVGGLVFNGVQTNGDYMLGYNWNDKPAAYNWASGVTVPQNQWSFVALVITPTNATVYVMNPAAFERAVNTTTHTNMAWNSTEYLGTEPGGLNGNRNYNGLLDEVGVYNKSLTADQLLGLYLTGLNVAALAPQITTQPSPQTVVSNTTAHFTVAAMGTAPLAYQWQIQSGGVGSYVNLSDVGNISGSTTNALAIANASATDVGNYQVIITNIMGAVTSTPAALTLGTGYSGARLAFKFQPNQNNNRNFVNGPAGALSTINWLNINWPSASNVIPYIFSGFNYEFNGNTNGYPSTTTLLSFQGGTGAQGDTVYNGSGTPAAGFTNWNANLLNSCTRFDIKAGVGVQGAQTTLALSVTNLDPVFATNGYYIYLYSLCVPNVNNNSNSVSYGQRNILINYTGATTSSSVAASQICSLYGTTNWNRFNVGDYLTNMPSFLQGTNILIQGVFTNAICPFNTYPSWETPGANYIVFGCPPSGAFSIVITNGSNAGISGIEIVANNTLYVPVSVGSPTVTPGFSVLAGTNVTMTCATNGGLAPYGVQWQAGTDGITFSDLPGATITNLFLASVTTNYSGYYRMVYTAGGVSVASSAVHLTVTNNVTTPPVLGFTHGGGSLTLTWTSGMLLQATNVIGPWTTNTGATSPFIITPTGPMMFYRLLVP